MDNDDSFNPHKEKWYVVWKGRKPGIYNSWEDCSRQVRGFPNALFVSKNSEDDAKEAFMNPPSSKKPRLSSSSSSKKLIRNCTYPCIISDGSCFGSNISYVEYRCVLLETNDSQKIILGSFGPFPNGTNNIGEYLGLVYALIWASFFSFKGTIYSDSEVAIDWVKNRKANSQMTNIGQILSKSIDLANNFLLNGTSDHLLPNIQRWNTHEWGENPADFNRK
jgi:ribonuclease HI